MYEIREATLPDATALYEHLTAVFSERLPALFARSSLPSLETVRDRIAENGASPNSAILIANTQGCIIGTLDFDGYRRLSNATLVTSECLCVGSTGVEASEPLSLTSWLPGPFGTVLLA